VSPWSRVLLETSKDSQLMKNFTIFYGIWKFTPAPTTAHYLFLIRSHMNLVGTHSTSWRSTLILSSHLRLGLPSGQFPSAFPTKPATLLCCMPSSSPYSWCSLFKAKFNIIPRPEAQMELLSNLSWLFKGTRRWLHAVYVLSYIAGLPIKLGSNLREGTTSKLTVGPFLSTIQSLQGLSLELKRPGHATSHCSQSSA